ncbi:MAG: oligosaccharide flippase family protein [Sphingobium sp.]|jgi:O-antigen/teichoic acid export membrane protein|nr:oligosaccharide flippase family protein [Sphingobium sp.]MCI1272001.1 oligosaccharide flippase family protein [Sphingobium sp.]MCI1755964.1 oligosaccharide flippase family protein [Sphingobium sp.]MCI2054117.1 oligosaccharide flippase family protein [Sphingobium sp.]
MTTKTSTPPRVWLKSDKPLAKIARNVLWLLSGKGVSAVLSLVYLALVTRSLGVENFGRFALVLSIGTAIVQFVQFECWQVVVRFGATHLHTENRTALGRLVGACQVFDVMGFLLGCGIAWLATALLVHEGQWDASTSETAFLYCCVVLAAVRSTPAGVLRLYNRFDLSIYAETMVSICRMIGTGIVMLMGPSIDRFLVVWALSEVCASITFWLLAYRLDPHSVSPRHALRVLSTLKEEQGLPRFLLVTNLGTTLSGLAGQAPVLALGIFVSPASAGLYRLAAQLTQALSKVTKLISGSAYAELNHMRARDGIVKLSKVLKRANRLMASAGVLLILLIALLGKPLLLLIAGPAFTGAYPLLLLLGIAAAINLVGVSYEPALLAVTDGIAVLRRRVVITCVYLGLTALALPIWGATGAATASIIAALTGLIIYAMALRQHIHEPASRAALQQVS